MRLSLIEFCFLLLSMILSSCNEAHIENKTIAQIDIEANINNLQKIYLSQVSDNIRYVPLESNRDNLISWTSGIHTDFSDKYILDSNGKVCLLYDNEGHFIRQIGNLGRGPGEYNGISCVYLMNDKIYIHDYYTDDLIEYKIDGTLVTRHKSGFTGNGKYRMEYLEPIMINDSMIFGNIDNRTGQDEYKALIIDKKGNIQYAYKNYILFDLAPGVGSVKTPGKEIIYRFDRKVYFKEYLNDTLFQLDAQYHLKPMFVFDFGKYKLPLSARSKKWNQIDLSSYIYLDNIYPTKDNLIINCGFGDYFPAKRLTPEIIKLQGIEDYTQWYNTTAVTGIYDKKSGNLIFSEPTSTDNHLFTSGLYNDIDAGPRFMPGKMVNDSTMVMKIRFDHLTEHIESNDFKNNIPKYPEKKKRLETLVDSLKKFDFDNPIYVFVTFNK